MGMHDYPDSCVSRSAERLHTENQLVQHLLQQHSPGDLLCSLHDKLKPPLQFMTDTWLARLLNAELSVFSHAMQCMRKDAIHIYCFHIFILG